MIQRNLSITRWNLVPVNCENAVVSPFSSTNTHARYSQARERLLPPDDISVNNCAQELLIGHIVFGGLTHWTHAAPEFSLFRPFAKRA